MTTRRNDYINELNHFRGRGDAAMAELLGSLLLRSLRGEDVSRELQAVRNYAYGDTDRLDVADVCGVAL